MSDYHCSRCSTGHLSDIFRKEMRISVPFAAFRCVFLFLKLTRERKNLKIFTELKRSENAGKKLLWLVVTYDDLFLPFMMLLVSGSPEPY